MSSAAESRASRVGARLAYPLLWVHVALILFSTAALITILAGPEEPEWVRSGIAAEVYRLGWMLSGPTYVVLGALAALAHATGILGWRRALALLAAGSLISLSVELIGTATELPFGPYSYTTLLGHRIAGLVPFPIPLSWFFMVYCSLAICGRLLPARDDASSRLLWSFAAGAVLTAWDVAMDPAMSRATAHWVWYTDGFFYGMPLSNWLGWFATGSLIARVMLSIVPTIAFAQLVSPTTLPIVLYAINGLMPLALVARHEMWTAFIVGFCAMAIPVALALRARPARAGALGQEARPVEAKLPGD